MLSPTLSRYLCPIRRRIITPSVLLPKPIPLLRSIAFPIQTTTTSLRFHNTTSSPGHTSSTVDPSEVSHFSALASTWWDPDGPSRILHLMNPIRIQFIQCCLAQSRTAEPQEGLRYLDIGCGGGILSESLARLPNTKSVVGIDPTTEVLRIAEAHRKRDPMLVGNGRLSYVNTTIHDFSIDEGEEFDVITAMEVLEHVPNPRDFLREMALRVKPGGWLVMSTIARHWMSYLTTKVLAEGVLRIVPWGTHDWDKYINIDEIKCWMEECGEMPGFVDFRGAEIRVMGVLYVPGVGWKEVPNGEQVGNYFVGIRRGHGDRMNRDL